MDIKTTNKLFDQLLYKHIIQAISWPTEAFHCNFLISTDFPYTTQ